MAVSHAGLAALLAGCIIGAVACGGGGGGGSKSAATQPLPVPVLTGQLKVEGDPPPPNGRGPQRSVRFVPGEVIVELEPGARLGELLAAHASLGLELLRAATDTGPYLLRLANAGADPNAARAAVLAAIKRLSLDPRVRYAEPNGIVFAARAPNDPRYAAQWHYDLIDLEGAWDVTVGDRSVVIAVVDTGVRPDHPDLKGRLLPGYDFVSDPATAHDGDGYDPDPTDEFVPIGSGDTPQSFHGTHVAGTIGAMTDNGIGVAGVTWRCPILPVRALAGETGTVFDIANGIRWAAGLPVAGVPSNPTPARVINLSLGSGFPSRTERDAVEAALNAGAIVVAAAGNDGQNVASYPAAYPGVISVASVGPTLERASYSNFHDTVFIAAPGGEQVPYESYGVLSTGADARTQTTRYTWLQGTSMAAPHVAGVIGLILSVNPTLDASGIRSILASTAIDLGAPGRDPEYGHGLLQAGAAVRAAANAPAAPPRAALSPRSITLESHVDRTTLLLTNLGGGSVTISNVDVYTFGTGSWMTATPSGNSAPARIELQIDRTSLGIGRHHAQVTVTTNAGQQTADVWVEKFPVPDVGPIEVELVDADTGIDVARTTADVSSEYRFSFPGPVPDGDYYVFAWTDTDGDGQPWSRIDEFVGLWPDWSSPAPVHVSSSSPTRDVRFHAVRAGEAYDRAGSGGGTIRGALHVRVRDAEAGLPIEGAEVMVGSGPGSVRTGRRGRVTIVDPALQGPQTISVTAPGYEAQSFVDVDAQYVGFDLQRTASAGASPGVTLSVIVDGLGLLDDEVYVIAQGRLGSDTGSAQVPLLGGSVQVDLTVPSGAPVAITAIVYDGGWPTKLALHFPRPDELYLAPTTVNLTAAPPPGGFGTLGGSLLLPTGGAFDATSATVSSVVYLFGPYGTAWWIPALVPDPANLAAPIPSFGPTVDPETYAWLILAAQDGAGQSTMAVFPGTLDVHLGSVVSGPLPEVAWLLGPADGATVNRTPILEFDLPQPHIFGTITLEDLDDGSRWVLRVPAGNVLLQLPPLAGGLHSSHRYRWSVEGVGWNGARYDELDLDYAQPPDAAWVTGSEQRIFTVQ
ncbi:MAG: hypothetical protein D6776_11260 [Planctomycetota bacterium]|nr:MAG: hypothetical protein D6776_11260 [Planctomycetota bacterium]